MNLFHVKAAGDVVLPLLWDGRFDIYSFDERAQWLQQAAVSEEDAALDKIVRFVDPCT